MTEFEALTDSELDELDEFLFAQMEAGRQTMLLGAAHGFYTAELCGPQPMPFSDAIDLVLGEAAFESERQHRRLRALLGRLWLEVEAQLDAGEDFEPLLHQIEGDDGQPQTLFADWCLGFIDAVENSEAWQERLASDSPPDEIGSPEQLLEQLPASVTVALTPIVTLSYRGLWEAQQMVLKEGGELDEQDALDLPAVFRDEVAELTPQQVQTMIDLIGPCVLRLDELNADWRADSDAAAQMPVRVDKIGRNDPCPCGSGRKYKKCCGAAANDSGA